ncbi:MAG: RsmB/NOP family class I SAM-dependent RNA methyltransferase [Hyphomicrobiaceae bacterium]
MQAAQQKSKRRRTPEGLEARELAVRLIAGVLADRKPFEQVQAACLAHPRTAQLEPRDRAFARAIAATVLRRQGELEFVLASFLKHPPRQEGRLWSILLTGTAQLVCLELPAHAVVDLAVETARRDPRAHRFAKLVNAVLRRVAAHGRELLSGQDGVRLNVPDWLWRRWSAAYGEDTARRIATASLTEAALDISVKPGGAMSVEAWAERLGGYLLRTGSVRLPAHGRIEDLPGYGDGAWWIQDAGAALVARVAGEVSGRSVADLCAAPGGKTAALAAGGAHVTAVDLSAARLARLRHNLERLRLFAEVVEADAAAWSPRRNFDVVVLDAPCTATGTIRRHPDILRLKRAEDVGRMALQQHALLAHAGSLVRPGGLLVYSTCSLEPEEGAAQIDAFLAAEADFARMPITANEIGGEPEWVTPGGDLRTLPFHLPQEPPSLSGIDGFFAARLQRRP